MGNFGFNMWGSGMPGWSGGIFVLFMLWSLFWKGLALWHSARRSESIWFVILLIVNTLGILEIVYLFFVAKIKRENLFNTKKL
jgi:methionyl-tRNA synthetase